MPEHFIAFEDASSDMLAAAAYLAERIRSGDGHAEAMSAVVPRFLATGNVDLAAELANSVDDPFTRDKLLGTVAEKCAEIDDDEYAMQLAESIEEFGLRSQTLEHIALQRVAKGQIEKAIEIAHTLPHPDHIYASAAIRADSDGNSDLAKDLLARVEYPSAKVSALQAMAMRDLVNGEKEDCLTLLSESQNIAIDIEHSEERIRTLCDIGNHFVQADRKDLAIGAYDAAKQEAEKLDNIHRDAFIGAAVMGFLHAGSPDTADRTLDLVSDKTQMSNCLLAFSKYYWDRGEKDEALDALDESYQILRSQREMETRDSKARFALFGAIAAQYAGYEKAERAIEIASEIKDEGQRTNALSQVATLLTLRSEDEQARRALNAIPDEPDRAFALVSMSDAKEQLGDRDAAITLLDEAAHLVEDVPQLTARSWAYNEIAKRYASFGAVERLSDICSINLSSIEAIRDESNRAVAVAGLSDVMSTGKVELSDSDQDIIERLLAGK